MTYPVLLCVKDRNCLVIGGGKVAAGKIGKLYTSGAHLYIVSPELTSKVQDLLSEGSSINYEKRNFRESDLKGKFLVIAATGDRSLNEYICKLASERNVLSNSVNSRNHTSFSNMAVVTKGDIVIGIGSHGSRIKEVKEVKKKIKEELW